MSSEFSARRDRVFDALGAAGVPAAALFFSAPTAIRNNDVEHEYRQDSDLFYLSGFEEPESVLVLTVPEREVIWFVRPRDPEREVWDGVRAGVDGMRERFGATHAYEVSTLEQRLHEILLDREALHVRLGVTPQRDALVLAAVAKARARAKLGHSWPTTIVDPGEIVHEMRLVKSEAELATMRGAQEISREAHTLAMRAAKPGAFEYEIEAIFLETFRRRGSPRPAYGCIVGSGPNATVLHYRSNDRRMEAGELLLIDAGCELGSYASDITRTFPVSGKFRREQQAIYEIVLAANEAGIARATVGGTLDDIHATCVTVVTQGLLDLGLLQGTLDDCVRAGAHKKFFMHKTSHWLGMDVHDVGRYHRGKAPRPLAEGMVLTVEPGIYIAESASDVPEAYRGIGVRIEDDVLVRAAGPENLSAGVPKSVDDLERACR